MTVKSSTFSSIDTDSLHHILLSLDHKSLLNFSLASKNILLKVCAFFQNQEKIHLIRFNAKHLPFDEHHHVFDVFKKKTSLLNPFTLKLCDFERAKYETYGYLFHEFASKKHPFEHLMTSYHSIEDNTFGQNAKFTSIMRSFFKEVSGHQMNEDEEQFFYKLNEQFLKDNECDYIERIFSFIPQNVRLSENCLSSLIQLSFSTDKQQANFIFFIQLLNYFIKNNTINKISLLLFNLFPNFTLIKNISVTNLQALILKDAFNLLSLKTKETDSTNLILSYISHFIPFLNAKLKLNPHNSPFFFSPILKNLAINLDPIQYKKAIKLLNCMIDPSSADSITPHF